MSGDGLVFEVINGLMSRPDWRKALKIPIGCIPQVLEMLSAMQNKCMYSFLSVTWGIIADVDYESEKYRRSLGSKRFLVLFAQRIFDLRSYRGRLSFLPIIAFPDNSSGEDAKVRKLSRLVLDSNPGSCENSLSGSECQLDGMDDCNWPSGNGLPKRSYTLPEGFNLQDKNEDLDNLPRNSRHHSENDLSMALDHSSHRNLSFNSCHDVSNSSYLIRNGNTVSTSEPFQETSTTRHSNSCHTAQECVHLKSQQMVTADNVIIREETMTVRKGEFVPTPLLPPLDEDVPSKWVVIEDSFISMSASYQTHLGADFLSAPDSRFNDGIIHLHFIRAGVSRNSLIGLFRALEDGSHVDSPFVESFCLHRKIFYFFYLFLSSFFLSIFFLLSFFLFSFFFLSFYFLSSFFLSIFFLSIFFLSFYFLSFYFLSFFFLSFFFLSFFFLSSFFLSSFFLSSFFL
ncbi:SPHK [Acanthosepion pharaonis]|uniref:SPHK n=1 Tax=Acanthosepion pharaonis TaxID=158019 RepID=A0A812DR79_ACAPH|nr:SPHK [Sepia pharaonis]